MLDYQPLVYLNQHSVVSRAFSCNETVVWICGTYWGECEKDYLAHGSVNSFGFYVTILSSQEDRWKRHQTGDSWYVFLGYTNPQKIVCRNVIILFLISIYRLVQYVIRRSPMVPDSGFITFITSSRITTWLRNTQSKHHPVPKPCESILLRIRHERCSVNATGKKRDHHQPIQHGLKVH